MKQSHADVRPTKERLVMMRCIELPDRRDRKPSFECIEFDETILFAVGTSPAHEHEVGCTSDRRLSDCIAENSLSEFGIADPARAAGMVLMRPVTRATSAVH